MKTHKDTRVRKFLPRSRFTSNNEYSRLEPRHLLATNQAPTFSIGDGIVTTNVAFFNDVANCMAVQADGKVVVGGISSNGWFHDFSIARYLPDGSLDPSFGSGDGKTVPTYLGGGDHSGGEVIVQPDGKILRVGTYQYESDRRLLDDSDIALYRLLADGSPDPSFGGGKGFVFTSIGPGFDTGASLALQPDGKIVVAGTRADGTDKDMILVRYLPNGSLDLGFGGGDGIVTTEFSTVDDFGQAVVVQADGKILVAGESQLGANSGFALVRFRSDGSLDSGFGNGQGLVKSDFGGESAATSMALQLDGRILLAGYSDNGQTYKVAVARYSVDGLLDNTFGGAGYVLTSVGSANDYGRDLMLQPDGRILVAGSTYNQSSHFWDSLVIRYLADGSLDPSFGGGAGSVRTSVSPQYDFANSVALQASGRILVAGGADNDSSSEFALVGYRPDGTLDSGFGVIHTLGGTLDHAVGGSPDILDWDVRIFDPELSLRDDFSGASLTLNRKGGPNPADVFSAEGTLAPLIEGSSLVVGGTVVGTVTQNSAGRLVLSFGANSTNARVDAVMQQINYVNHSLSQPDSAEIDWMFSDGNEGSQGIGGPMTVTGSVLVYCYLTNQTPTLNPLATFTLDEDATEQIVNLSGITAGQGESQLMKVSANSSNPSLLPNPTVSYNSPDSNGFIRFTPERNQFGTAIITVTVEDGGLDSDLTTKFDNLSFQRTFEVIVRPVNDAPAFGRLGANPDYLENSSGIKVFPVIQVADVDARTLAKGKLSVAVESAGEDGSRLWIAPSAFLAISGRKLIFDGVVAGTWSGGTGNRPLEVSFNDRASLNRVQHVLRQIYFAHDSEKSEMVTRAVSAQLKDGSGGLAVATKMIRLIPANDPPKLERIPASTVYTLNESPVSIARRAMVKDVDSSEFGDGELRVEITSPIDPSNRLSIGRGFTVDELNQVWRNGTVIGQQNPNGGFGATALKVKLNSNATRAVVEELLRAISFQTVGGSSTQSRNLKISLLERDATSTVAFTIIKFA